MYVLIQKYVDVHIDFLKTYIGSWRIWSWKCMNVVYTIWKIWLIDGMNNDGHMSMDECQWMEGAEQTKPHGQTLMEAHRRWTKLWQMMMAMDGDYDNVAKWSVSTSSTAMAWKKKKKKKFLLLRVFFLFSFRAITRAIHYMITT